MAIRDHAGASETETVGKMVLERVSSVVCYVLDLASGPFKVFLYNIYDNDIS